MDFFHDLWNFFWMAPLTMMTSKMKKTLKTKTTSKMMMNSMMETTSTLETTCKMVKCIVYYLKNCWWLLILTATAKLTQHQISYQLFESEIEFDVIKKTYDAVHMHTCAKKNDAFRQRHLCITNHSYQLLTLSLKFLPESRLKILLKGGSKGVGTGGHSAWPIRPTSGIRESVLMATCCPPVLSSSVTVSDNNCSRYIPAQHPVSKSPILG